VTITGTYTVSLTADLGRDAPDLGAAGQRKAYAWVVQNTGSGPLANLTVSATPPTGWTVTFDAATIPSLARARART